MPIICKNIPYTDGYLFFDSSFFKEGKAYRKHLSPFTSNTTV